MKNRNYLCGAIYTQRRGNSSMDGYFYALTADEICGSDTPVSSVNAPTAFEVDSNGKGRNRLFISGQQTLSVMLSTERCLNWTFTPNSNRVAHETSRHIAVIPTDNVYIQSVFHAFRQFLIEEASGCVYTTLRLQKALDRARKEHLEHRKALCTELCFRGDLDETNTTLVFTQNIPNHE